MTQKREIFGWAMYDFANSGFTTVVLTAVFNSYFIAVIAGDMPSGTATLIWTIIIAVANIIVLFASPIAGSITDTLGNKKTLLFISMSLCTLFTAALFFAHQGDIVYASLFVILSSVMFFIGESIVAAFLPEISNSENIGKISGFGWALGYVGGLLVLGLCLYYINMAQARGEEASEFVPFTMLIVAGCFFIASLPTFIFLKEQRITKRSEPLQFYIKSSFNQVKSTWHKRHTYSDMFRFMASLLVFYSGINTVVVIAAIYAQEVMDFQTSDTIQLILVVNVAAAIGAFIFGFVQDKLGIKNTLNITLFIWILAMLIAYFTSSLLWFWVVALLIGIALGSSQSAGRALVGSFSPRHHNGEFFGFWGLTVRLSAVVGPISYGLVAHFTNGDHKMSLLSTTFFFIAGFLLLRMVNEERGKKTAQSNSVSPL